MQVMDSANRPIKDISERIRAAAGDKTPLRICGGGSKDFYGLRLQGEPLSTLALKGIVSYEPSELVITALAGTPLLELQALLASQGQCLAFEPPHFGAASTVGGMVAAGLSGPSRANVGAVRDFVLGLEMINGQGELLRYGGQVMKNVAGYDVSRLMAGSWGTLGVITEVSLKVLPVAPAEATLRFDSCSQHQALDWLNHWGGQPLPLNASNWLEEDGKGTLYLRLRGARAAVQAAALRLGGERLDSDTNLDALAADWSASRDLRLPWFEQRAPDHCLWRLFIPAATAPLPLPPEARGPFIDWHGAQRWVQAPRSSAAALQKLAHEAGGSASLFRAESPYQISATSDFDIYAQSSAAGRTSALLHARLKQAFDPAGILNVGRLSAKW
ncbi:glycolate oxidase subunit GlcE [Comamonas sp. Y33R10-2]|uniref:glycolate oxidase subunit GlcE n=1 Tax=Comamonas sp. Y33R10-2 TaxID=2853257 RepID=UPI001C5C8AFB|nr:glycolate oxidase subunit GlcE [Comamonas sp. Y33R10-2]QXZ11410.1 glycolate oxidase subunit GlcE [Comamonas sp. Y33R10-2]